MKRSLRKRYFLAFALLLFTGGFTITTDNFSQFGGTPHSERLERMKNHSIYKDKKFVNPVETALGPTARENTSMLYRYIFGKEVRSPEMAVPVDRKKRAYFDTPPQGGLRITWMGHSSTLIEIDGARILTDPMWSLRSSPSQIFGPKRFYPTPISLEELPFLDAVVISHDHYDHLDKATVTSLAPTGVKFIVPLGVGAHLKKWGISPEQITELDWWGETIVEFENVKVVATPARHFSGRGIFDENATLWASFALIGAKHKVFYSGDTGLFSGMAEIGKKLGPFDVTLLDVGGYDRSCPDIHLNPIRAVEAHQMLRGKLLIPIHWGTFNLAIHDWFEPADLLSKTAEKAGVEVAIPRPGESVLPGKPVEAIGWWDALKGDGVRDLSAALKIY